MGQKYFGDFINSLPTKNTLDTNDKIIIYDSQKNDVLTTHIISIGTKKIDESNISDGKVLMYNQEKDMLEYKTITTMKINKKEGNFIIDNNSHFDLELDIEKNEIELKIIYLENDQNSDLSIKITSSFEGFVVYESNIEKEIHDILSIPYIDDNNNNKLYIRFYNHSDILTSITYRIYYMSY
ncbi:MAG: hypothetical protein ACOC3V_02885 [bacterium]